MNLKYFLLKTDQECKIRFLINITGSFDIYVEIFPKTDSVQNYLPRQSVSDAIY